MKVLVVGAGYWGPNMVRNLVDFPEVELIGISDLDVKRAESVAKKFPRTRVEPPAPMAFGNGYDATIIVTPVQAHFSIAMQALDAGLHVLVEKPLTRTPDESRKLIEHAEQKNLRLMVGHVFHYKPEVQALVHLVQSGELGAIRYIDSVRVNLGVFRPDVNVMWDLAPHDLTIFGDLISSAPLRVSATGARHVHPTVTPHETMVLMTLDYGEGVLGHIHVNWFSPIKQRLMVICGDKKMAVYDDLSVIDPVRVYDRGMYDPQIDNPDYPVLRLGDTHIPHIRQEEPLKRELREFFTAIREDRSPETGGNEGLRVVNILTAAMQSLSRDGSFVDIPSV